LELGHLTVIGQLKHFITAHEIVACQDRSEYGPQ
jgi:hypothetical protein